MRSLFSLLPARTQTTGGLFAAGIVCCLPVSLFAQDGSGDSRGV